jgi:heme oxygenase
MLPTTHRSPAKFRERLRLATRVAHERLEVHVNLEGLAGSLESYRSVLEQLLCIYRPIEASLAKLDLAELGICYEARRKVSWLEEDLKDLGHTADSLERLPAVRDFPAPKNCQEALGMLYVLEGSSLGGQLILRKLAPVLNIGPLWAGRFYHGYGKNTGAMWQSFVAVLNAAGDAPDAASRIEAAALATFAAFEKHLAQGHCPFVPSATDESSGVRQ